MSIPVKILNDKMQIPMLGLGTWMLEGQICFDSVRMALDIGYTHIDTAFAYNNQKEIGRAIKGYEREKLFITSKLWKDYLYPEKIELLCDECLRQLDTDYIDLLLIHWPDSSRPLLKIVEKMHSIKEKGKIKSVGVSNYTIHHLQDLVDEQIPVSVNQVEFHPFLYQKELLEFCNMHMIALTAYSPIARGKVFEEPALIQIAQAHKKNPAQISLHWLLQKDIIVVPKGSSREHLKENRQIFDFSLSKQEMQMIDEISQKNKERLIQPDFHEFDY